MKGLRRELGRWSSSGCGGFEIHGGELAKSAGEWGGRSSVAHGVGRERESDPRERVCVREWARVGEEDVLAFNAAHGVAGEGSMAGT